MNIYLESDKPLEEWGRFLVETIHELDGFKVRGVAVVALLRQDTDEDFQAVTAYQNMALQDKQEAVSLIEADVTKQILKANLRDMLDELEGEGG